MVAGLSNLVSVLFSKNTDMRAQVMWSDGSFREVEVEPPLSFTSSKITYYQYTFPYDGLPQQQEPIDVDVDVSSELSALLEVSDEGL